MTNSFFPSFYTFHPKTCCQTICYCGKIFSSNHKDETKTVQQDIKRFIGPNRLRVHTVRRLSRLDDGGLHDKTCYESGSGLKPFIRWAIEMWRMV